MSNLQSLKLLISKMSGNENHLTVNTTFVHFMNSLEGGVFLSQLVYWSDKTKRTDGYFYKTYEEWTNEICISKHAVMKNVSKLKDIGILETKVKKANGNPTLHYMLHYDRLCESIISFLQKQNTESSKTEERKFVKELSLTEITTENTTKNIKPLSGKPDPIDYQGLINYFNLKTGRNFKATDAFKRMINGRLKEGHQKMDFKIVIDKKCDEWLGTDMESYLRPNTLFCPKHFDNYLNQPAVSRKNNKSAQLNAFEALERKYSNESESSVSTVKENQLLLSE